MNHRTCLFRMDNSKEIALDLLKTCTLKGYDLKEMKIQIDNEVQLDDLITKLIDKQKKL